MNEQPVSVTIRDKSDSALFLYLPATICTAADGDGHGQETCIRSRASGWPETTKDPDANHNSLHEVSEAENPCKPFPPVVSFGCSTLPLSEVGPADGSIERTPMLTSINSVMPCPPHAALASEQVCHV